VVDGIDPLQCGPDRIGIAHIAGHKFHLLVQVLGPATTWPMNLRAQIVQNPNPITFPE
jgi:hypothetical protein